MRKEFPSIIVFCREFAVTQGYENTGNELLVSVIICGRDKEIEFHMAT